MPQGGLTAQRVKEAGASQRRPLRGRTGVEPSGDISLLAREPTSRGSSVTREPRPTGSGSKADLSQAARPAGATPRGTPDWHAIPWKKVLRTVRRLQARIVKALQEGRWGKVKALVYLLTHSFAGRTHARGRRLRLSRPACAALA